MALKNFTTKIDVDKTISEIQTALVKAGAARVMSEYDDTGNIIALSFQLKINEQFIAFTLPTDWRPVLKILQDQGVVSKNLRYQETAEAQARRTAWRITKDWIEAQLAIVQMRMATTAQVFLPYAKMNDGKSIYEHFALDTSQLLESGENR